MGFNYAAEKKKFETLWARLRREYRAAGMSDTAIQKMHDFDWEVFKQERIYRLHTQDLGIGIFDEPSAEQEDKSRALPDAPSAAPRRTACSRWPSLSCRSCAAYSFRSSRCSIGYYYSGLGPACQYRRMTAATLPRIRASRPSMG